MHRTSIALLLLGCGSSPTLDVLVRSDLTPGEDVTSVHMIVRPNAGGAPIVDRTESIDARLYSGVRLSETLAPANYRLEVELLGPRPQSPHIVTVDLSESRLVPITFSRQCRDVRCAANETCVG